MAQTEALVCHSAPGLRVYVEDVFDLTPQLLGPVALTFDRAALFAQPFAVRARSADHLVDVTAGAPQLLISVVYDQNRVRGPPFSVPDAEVQSLYAARHDACVPERVNKGDDEMSFQDVV